MTFKDSEFIAKDEHELNYVLKKYGYRQTKDNRDKFEDLLDQFRKDSAYAPHKRDDFYRYMDATNCFDCMEKDG